MDGAAGRQLPFGNGKIGDTVFDIVDMKIQSVTSIIPTIEHIIHFPLLVNQTHGIVVFIGGLLLKIVDSCLGALETSGNDDVLGCKTLGIFRL